MQEARSPIAVPNVYFMQSLAGPQGGIRSIQALR
jgi:hypothetical protein